MHVFRRPTAALPSWAQEFAMVFQMLKDGTIVSCHPIGAFQIPNAAIVPN